MVAGEGIRARAVVLVGKGIRSRENDTEWLVGVSVRAGAQPVGRASQEFGGDSTGKGRRRAKLGNMVGESQVIRGHVYREAGICEPRERAEREAIEGCVGLGNLRASGDTQVTRSTGPESWWGVGWPQSVKVRLQELASLPLRGLWDSQFPSDEDPCPLDPGSQLPPSPLWSQN